VGVLSDEFKLNLETPKFENTSLSFPTHFANYEFIKFDKQNFI